MKLALSGCLLALLFLGMKYYDLKLEIDIYRQRDQAVQAKVEEWSRIRNQAPSEGWAGFFKSGGRYPERVYRLLAKGQ